jgi:ribosomal protein S18 acetylase RimI-like enzyme
VTSPLRIRLAGPGDVDDMHAALRAIGRHLGREDRIVSTPEDLRRFGFGEGAQFETLVAASGRSFAGMCLFFRSFSTWRGVPGAYVQDLFVAEEHRGRGVGEALIRATARHVLATGGAYLRLSVESGNESARAFYERIGLQRAETERIHAAYGAAFLALAEDGDSG